MRQAEPSIEAFQEMEAWIPTLTKPATQDDPGYDAKPIFQQAVKDLIEEAINKKKWSVFTTEKWGSKWEPLEKFIDAYNASVNEELWGIFRETAKVWIAKQIKKNSVLEENPYYKPRVIKWAKKYGVTVPK